MWITIGSPRMAAIGASVGVAVALASVAGVQAMIGGAIQACVNPDTGVLLISPSKLVPDPSPAREDLTA